MADNTIPHEDAVRAVIDDVIEEGVGTTGEAIPNAAVNASVAHALNSTFSDTEAEAALNALGTKINANGATLNAILAILRTNGIIAT